MLDNMKTIRQIMKNFFLSNFETYDGKTRPAMANIKVNSPTKRLASSYVTLKYSLIIGMMPGMLRKVDVEKAIKNRENIKSTVFLSIM